jgi:hypothetical protein
LAILLVIALDYYPWPLASSFWLWLLPMAISSWLLFLVIALDYYPWPLAFS